MSSRVYGTISSSQTTIPSATVTVAASIRLVQSVRRRALADEQPEAGREHRVGEQVERVGRRRERRLAERRARSTPKSTSPATKSSCPAAKSSHGQRMRRPVPDDAGHDRDDRREPDRRVVDRVLEERVVRHRVERRERGDPDEHVETSDLWELPPPGRAQAKPLRDRRVRPRRYELWGVVSHTHPIGTRPATLQRIFR